ncbi:DUF3489 domain-containing protein [Aliiruegeria lutimaris]|uniref:DUF3489 domain-containing protein n=1 Tax=Aliiruegeria lutimaris TaxID=571298 RepID=A0A1G9DMQ0_9RHOB|nr:DUF3489 domain-containing protein [Aliiruegeria lutimaris]SDK65133.1 Protein of unknown function [Aliiruegeria lutimaris]
MPDRKRTTKIESVRSLLRRPAGASLEAICKTTGWQKHSARAALSTLRKNGAAIERRTAERDDAPATYHMIEVAETSS